MLCCGHLANPGRSSFCLTGIFDLGSFVEPGSAAVIDKNPLRAAVLEEGLRAAGHTSVVHIDDTAELLERIRAIDPDVILIDLESSSRDILEQMFKVSLRSRGPLPCSSTVPMRR
jgi:CheY-like chemotaxis protein